MSLLLTTGEGRAEGGEVGRQRRGTVVWPREMRGR
jgi:hypothetical protein